MSWLKMQSGRTVGKMRSHPRRAQGSSPNSCNRASRHPEKPFPLGKYRLWDALDPTGLKLGDKGFVWDDSKSLSEGMQVRNFKHRSR